MESKVMFHFLDFLNEEATEGAKLKHIHHAEDRPFFHGESGFEHAHGALMGAHHHTVQGVQSNKLTMKYDGSPAVVFGHHPETGKFFVASKSAFNKNPKINYTPEDVDNNHGHAPGLAEKLKHALQHLPKIAPKEGVYQGDLMYSGKDVQKNKDGSASFTPNTITYTAHGDRADAIKKSKLGIVIHTKYEGDTLSSMHAHHDVDPAEFGHHPDVFHHTADYDSKGANYTQQAQDAFHKEMNSARDIHHAGGKKMYKAISMHGGESGHLATYINQTVRTGEQPTAEGLQKHIADKYQKMVSKLKTEKSQNAKLSELQGHLQHIQKNSDQYENALKMHSHLQAAKNHLVSSLEANEGNYAHAIGGVASKPEGFVYSHTHEGVTEPTKLVNRAEFARQNLLKARPGAAPKEDDGKHGVMAYGRMNPPTVGHEQVVNKVQDVAKKTGGIHKIVLSHSQDPKKNPLPVDVKVKHAQNAFPGANIEGASSEKPTIMHHASDMAAQGVQHLHVVAGSDRVEEYKKLLNAYNGKEGKHGNYNFKSITVHSSGERDPDAEGTAGVSGTKMRELAAAGKTKEFHAGLPTHMKPEHKDALMHDLVHHMSQPKAPK
jgi:hypothetical protein